MQQLDVLSHLTDLIQGLDWGLLPQLAASAATDPMLGMAVALVVTGVISLAGLSSIFSPR